MKKLSAIVVSLLFAVSGQAQQWTTSGTNIYNANTGNVGIGTSTPITKLQTMDAANGGSPNTTTPTMGILLSGSGTNGSLNLGIDATGTFYSWIQSRNKTANISYNLALNPNGANVGIGLTAPLQKLHINGNFRVDGPSGTTHSDLEFYRADGVKFATIGQGILANANSTFDIQHFNGNDIRFLNNTVEQMRILATNGNVGIGCVAPDQKLTVKGIIHAQEVRVDLNVPGPDYVFNKSYKLPSLQDVKSFIDQNKHLPEIPSAAEMQKNGLQLGEMNLMLLKKVEELTLYMIQIKKENDDLKARLEKIENAKRH